MSEALGPQPVCARMVIESKTGQVACGLCRVTMFKGSSGNAVSLTPFVPCGGFTPPPWEGEWRQSDATYTDANGNTQRNSRDEWFPLAETV